MYLNSSKIRRVFEESKYSKREVVTKCGFTRPTLDGLLQGADVKVSTLVAFAKFFDVPISFFFDEENVTEIRKAGRDFHEYHDKVEEVKVIDGYSQSESREMQNLRDQIEQLKSQLADKEKIIQLLEG